jgi:hypothetical protein
MLENRWDSHHDWRDDDRGVKRLLHRHAPAPVTNVTDGSSGPECGDVLSTVGGMSSARRGFPKRGILNAVVVSRILLHSVTW